MSFSGTYKDLDDHCKVLLADIKKITQAVPDIWRSLVSLPPPIISRPVLNKFGWWVFPSNVEKFNIPKLVVLHFILKHYGYIVCEYKDFESHFINENKPTGNSVEWIGDIMILVLLFDVFMNEKKIIPPANSLYDILYAHFVLFDKRTNRIKKLSRGSLKSSLSNAKKNPSVNDIVKNICSLLLS